MTEVSYLYRHHSFEPETDVIPFVLLTIAHDDLAEPIRLVNNTENITSRGNEFIAFPFELSLPDDQPGAPPRARVSIDNVTTDIARAIRTITSAPSILIEIILSSDPDTVEMSWPYLDMKTVKWTGDKAQGDLTMEGFQTEPYPAHIFTPAYAPGVL